MPIDTTNLNLLWTSLLIEELVRHGVTACCLSPGSRSAPLAVALARHPGMQVTICYDERAAAFFALGQARAAGKPALLVCTSGTAAAHYLPAVIEASQDGVPLLILSADRPPELIDAGANQAIRQDKLYGDYVRWFCNFPCPDAAIPPQWVLTTVDQAVHRCLQPIPGPVHLNLPFREPLAPTPRELKAPAALLAWEQSGKPYTRIQTSAGDSLDPSDWEALSEAVEAAEQGLLIIGRLRSGDERQAALDLANGLGWPVFADVLSGLRLDARLLHQIPYYDQLLASESFAAACRPDTVLHLGGNYVSGRLLRQLAEHPPEAYLQLQTSSDRLDPNHMVGLRIEGELTALCDDLGLELGLEPGGEPHESHDPDWLHSLQAMAAEARSLYRVLDEQDLLSEAGLARLLSQLLPEGQTLMLGNSLPVREVDGFADPRDPAPRVFGNRGTSGIDGHVATACGYALASQRPLTLLCGDLTLFHDLNSLYLLQQINQPVTVVVVNNGGGGIFSFLPIAAHEDVFEPYFGTPHQLGFEAAARLFGLAYHAPQTRREFARAYQACQGMPALIEVRSTRQATLELQRELQKVLGERLEEQVSESD